MDVGGTSSRRTRVVALLRGPGLPGCGLTDLQKDGVEWVPVGSAYEAAAEILAAPTAALVIDLRAMGPRHVRLIEIARQMGVEMFASGALPIGMSAEELSGVRLVAGRDLPAMLEEMGEPPAAEAPEPAPAREEEPTKPKVRLRPAKRGTQPPSPHRPEPGMLLTSEELDALLEDES